MHVYILVFGYDITTYPKYIEIGNSWNRD